MTLRALHLVLILGAALAAGAFLRLDGLGEPSLWMDEMLHQVLTTKAVAGEPWWRWLTGFEAENGPLYYATLLVSRIGGTGEAAVRSSAALFGLAAIALVFVIARRDRDASVAAILLAASPLHVYYSREARPYALLMLLTAALIVVLLRGRSVPAAVLVLAAMAYTAAVAAPVIAAAALTAFLAACVDREHRRFYVTVGSVAVVLLAFLPLLYRGAAETVIATAPPAFDGQFFDALARNFGVTALASPLRGRTAYVLLALAIVGAVSLAMRDRRAAIVIAGMALLPLVAALTALAVFDRWYAVRYVTPALVGYALLAGFGIAAVARPFRGAAPFVAVAIAMGIAAQTWAACRVEPWQKLDWRGIARTLERYGRPGDVVIAAEPWSGLMLEYYRPKGVELLQLSTAALAEVAVQEHGAAWLVSGGFNPDVEVRRWMCGFPVLLGSPLENFRLHYTSRGGGDFLRERALEPELRAAGAAGVVLFGTGWAGPEGSFRWAAGRRAEVLLPRFGREDRTLRLRVNPFVHPSLPPQTMRITLNGRELQTVTLPAGWQELAVPAPAAAWRDGLNALAFAFGRATAPADFDPANPDPRPLAVAFDWTGLPPFAVRLPPLPEKRAFSETRFPPDRLDRKRVETLLGRLGLDPAIHWPKLARGETRLEDLVRTVTYGNDCLDGDTFARETFTLLLGRPPGEAELRSIAPVPRDRLAEWITRFEELDRNATGSH